MSAYEKEVEMCGELQNSVFACVCVYIYIFIFKELRFSYFIYMLSKIYERLRSYDIVF